jgi:uncharacterized protein YqhQ
MMRGPFSWSVVVRLRDGTLQSKITPHLPWGKRYKILGFPLIRGAVILLESLIIGYQALNFSAAYAELEDPQKKSTTPKKAPSQESLDPLALIFTLLCSVVLAIFLFLALPHYLSLGLLERFKLAENSFPFHVVDGVLKFLIFLLYVWAIGLIPEIKRVFSYHGAEHRAIYTYEASLPFEAQKAKTFPLWHPRCGTAFIFVLLFLSIIFFAIFFPLFFHYEGDSLVRRTLLSVGLKTLLMFPLAGISYEITRLAGAPNSSFIWKTLIFPGLLLQRLTTRETDDSQLEVALHALKLVLEAPDNTPQRL